MTNIERLVLFVLLGLSCFMNVFLFANQSKIATQFAVLKDQIDSSTSSLSDSIIANALDINILQKMNQGAIASGLADQEIKKLGGKDNYDEWQKVYSSDLYKSYMEKETKNQISDLKQAYIYGINTGTLLESMNTPINLTDPVDIGKYASGTLDTVKLAALNGMLKEDKNGDIGIIQVLNFGTGDAKILGAKNIISTLKSVPQYGDAIVAGEGYLQTDSSKLISLASECVYNIGKDKYFDFVSKISVLDSSIENISSLASSLGLDPIKLKSCIQDEQYNGIIASQNNFLEKNFSLNTNGYILYNKDTKKYFVTSGIQDISVYKALIDELLKK